MINANLAPDSLPVRLRQIIAEKFRLDVNEMNKITADAPLIDGTLGLDSLDALDLAMCIEEEFGITIGCREESRLAFGSIASLAEFIGARVQGGLASQGSPANPVVQTGMILSPSS